MSKDQSLKKHWSPTLQHAMDTVRLWTIVYKSRRGCNISKRSIIRLGKKLKITTNTITAEQARKYLNKAKTKYVEVSKNHATLRCTFLEDLALARAREGKTKWSSELRSLMKREEQRRVSRRIKIILNNNYIIRRYHKVKIINYSIFIITIIYTKRPFFTTFINFTFHK